MNREKKEREIITVRGIAASIQAMAMPTFANLRDMLSKVGWQLIRNNKQTNNESNEGDRNG
jgi:hypothetical protein